MKKITGNKKCPKCGGANEIKQLFTSSFYEDCLSCFPKGIIESKNNLYLLTATTILKNGTTRQADRCIIFIEKLFNGCEDVVCVTHDQTETEREIIKAYKDAGGKGDPMDSDDWTNTYIDTFGNETYDIALAEQTVQTLQFEGN